MTKLRKSVAGINNPNYKTGLCVAGKRWGGYNTWQNMKSRCLRPSCPKYHRYGGRGIKICAEWCNVKGFYDWAMANGYQDGLTIDRIDNDGDYVPENCRWVSMAQNSRAKTTTKITFEQAATIRVRAKNGESLYDLAKEYNVVHGTVWFIVKNFTHVADGECSKALKERDLKNETI